MVAEILQVSTTVVRGLVEAKLLPPPMKDRAARLFDRATVEKFQETHAFGPRLARARHMGSAVVERELHALSVRPVARIEVAGLREVSVYRKYDIERVGWRKNATE
jgi:hypothetical protein